MRKLHQRTKIRLTGRNLKHNENITESFPPTPHPANAIENATKYRVIEQHDACKYQDTSPARTARVMCCISATRKAQQLYSGVDDRQM